MATQRISYENKTDATPSNAAQWTGPDTNEVKNVVNNNADEVDTNTTNIAANTAGVNNAQADIDLRLEQNLGNFAPNTFTFNQSGYYNDYTPPGNVPLNPQGTPTINIWQKVTMIFDGVKTLTKSTNSVMYNHTSGEALPAGAYDLWISYVGGKFYYNVQDNDSDVIGPNLLSAVFANDNTYIDVTFNEGVYGANDGVTPVSLASFALTFVQNGDTATGWTASSAKKNDNTSEGAAGALTGGETVIRIFGSLAGSTNGLGYVTTGPADNSSIFDVIGNATPSTDTQDAALVSGNTVINLVASSSQYASISNPTGLAFANAGSDLPFSISTWLKATTVNDNMKYVHFGSFLSAGTDDNLWHYGAFIRSDGSIRIICYDATDPISNDIRGDSDPALIVAGTWYHIVCTYSGSGTQSGLNIWLDGALLTITKTRDGTYNSMPDGAASNELLVGRQNFTTNNLYFDGRLDDLAIWDKQLTGPEVAELYNSGTQFDVKTHSAYATNCVSLYEFDGGYTDSKASNDLTNSGSTLVPDVIS